MIAITKVAQEIGLDLRAREEFGVHAGIVEPRHRPAIQSESARGDDEIGSLKAAVAKGRRLYQRHLAFEHAFRIRVMWKQAGQMLMKIEIVTNDGRDRGRHRLVMIAR